MIYGKWCVRNTWDSAILNILVQYFGRELLAGASSSLCSTNEVELNVDKRAWCHTHGLLAV